MQSTYFGHGRLRTAAASQARLGGAIVTSANGSALSPVEVGDGGTRHPQGTMAAIDAIVGQAVSAALVSSGHSPLAVYAILFALLALAWAGLPTAGQAALVAAGVLAGDGRLDIVAVTIVGTAGSAVGGVAGYVLGRKGGRRAWSAPGPLHRRRLDALRSGDKLFARYGALAAFFVPMWLLGIVSMPWQKFLLWNALAALAWTTVGALGGYLIGPAATALLGRASTLLAVAAVAGIAGVILHRNRRRRADPSSTTDESDTRPR